MIYIECSYCQWKVSDFLIKGQSQPDRCEGEVALSGQYVINRQQLYVNTDQNNYLTSNAEMFRDFGCCGPGPDGLPNLSCYNCGGAIARECTDCIFPHFIRF